MDIKDLRAFVVVAQELNFRKAAEKLGMTQPPLTRLIANLEYQLGTTLLKRTTRKVELTGEGIHLLSRALKIIKDVENLEKEISSLHKKSKLKIALHSSAIHSHFPKLISSFKEQFPKVAIELVEIQNNLIEKKILNDEIDFSVGVIHGESPEIKSIQVHAYELGLLIPLDHRLAKKKTIQLGDLANETLIFHGKSDHLGFQADFHKFLERKKIHVNIYYKKAYESCPNLVVMGKGILITSKRLLPHLPNAHYASFANFSHKLKIMALWKENSSNPEVKAFVSFLEQHQLVPKSEMDYHLD